MNLNRTLNLTRFFQEKSTCYRKNTLIFGSEMPICVRTIYKMCNYSSRWWRKRAKHDKFGHGVQFPLNASMRWWYRKYLSINNLGLIGSNTMNLKMRLFLCVYMNTFCQIKSCAGINLPHKVKTQYVAHTAFSKFRDIEHFAHTAFSLFQTIMSSLGLLVFVNKQRVFMFSNHNRYPRGGGGGSQVWCW